VSAEQQRAATLLRQSEQVLAADVADLDPLRFPGPGAQAVEDLDRELSHVTQAVPEPRLARECSASCGPGVVLAEVSERRAPRARVGQHEVRGNRRHQRETQRAPEVAASPGDRAERSERAALGRARPEGGGLQVRLHVW
jgi:hypothetical protein